MPCYDPRDNSDSAVESRIRIKLINEFQHNSNLAEMLCSIMTLVGPENAVTLGCKVPGLKSWWDDHRARDAAKKGS